MTSTLISPRWRNRRTPCDILIFGEAPGQDEVAQGKAFVGKSGELLESILKIEVPEASVCIDNVYPAGDRVNTKPKAEDLAIFHEYVADRIDQCKPRVILALGESALKGLGIKAKPVKSCGLEFKNNGRPPVVACVHPAFILRGGGRQGKSQLHYFRLAFATVKGLLKKTQNKEKVERIDGSEAWGMALTRMQGDLCTVDLETDGFKSTPGGILCASVSNGSRTIWTPLFHKDNPDSAKVKAWKLRTLCSFWSAGPRIAHNAKFELKWFRACGADDPPQLFDTLLQGSLLSETEAHGLDHLAIKYLRCPPWWLRLPQNTAFRDAPIDVLGEYCAMDSLRTWQLHRVQRRKLALQLQLLADSLVTPLARELVSMEQRGMHCSRAILRKVVKRVQQDGEKKLKALAQRHPDINFKSNPQVGKLLFKQWGLPVLRRTKGGQPSIEAEVLEELAQTDPRVKPIVEARGRLNYADRIASLEDCIDGDDCIHTTYSLGNVVTWRLASSDPNLQNLDRPDESDAMKGIQRRAFTSRWGRQGCIIQWDYSQHELRWYTAVSGDVEFRRIFSDPTADIHAATAKAMGKPRPIAKNINFSILYAITPEGLKTKYGIEVGEGRDAIAAWHKVHPELKAFYMSTCKFLLDHGYVETVFGFRRTPAGITQVKREARGFIRAIEDDDAEFYYRASHEVRQIINVCIQGPAVCCSYLALIDLREKMRKFKALVVHQIHDSIVVDAPKSEKKKLIPLVTRVMENIDIDKYTQGRLHYPVPLKVDCKVGDNL